mgnify:CR=1 FL=1
MCRQKQIQDLQRPDRDGDSGPQGRTQDVPVAQQRSAGGIQHPSGRQPDRQEALEGDGKTPEGVYYISHRNPNSTYHLSLGISYPNNDDRAYAAAAGKPTGGDIFIHGGPVTERSKKNKKGDWTAGCIAVTDKQIEEIYSMVRPGTPIIILP